MVRSMSLPALYAKAHLDPDGHIPPHTPHQVLKLFALPQAVLIELSDIGDLLCGRLEALLLELPRLSQDLLGGDLQTS